MKKLLLFFKRNRVVTFTLAVVLVIGGYCLWVNRKPFTQNAFVVANVRAVSSYVPGYITDIYVKNNQAVKKGAKLFTVFQKPYELALKKLEKDIVAEKYNIKGLRNSIKIAENMLSETELEFRNSKYLSDQAAKLKTIIAQKDVETREKAMQESVQEYNMAKEQLELKKNLLKEAEAHLESIEAEREIAQLNLNLTTVYAKSDGYISNMHIALGTYVQAGETLFAFVDSRQWWLQANFTETQLSYVRKGMKTKIWLWQYPGIVFQGTVGDTGWGVDRISRTQFTGMPEVQKENQWFMLPQRFPVQIKINDIPKGYELHVGGSAYVEIETSARPIRQFFWRLFQL